MYAKILLAVMSGIALLTLAVGVLDTIQSPAASKDINASLLTMNDDKMNVNVNPADIPESEWKKRLSTDQYRVLREKGTERPWTGKFNDHFEPGVYKCAGCGAELFGSTTKFESHCGWPSFYEVLDKSKVREITDTSHGMVRTEVVCSACGGHLGHVFDDGPNPTGLRYCINSVSLDFENDSSGKK